MQKIFMKPKTLAYLSCILFTFSVFAKPAETPEGANDAIKKEYQVPDYVWKGTKEDPGPPSPPKPIKRQEPKYPKELKKLKMNGSALVSFVIETNGTTSNVVATKATNKYFAAAAEEAVKKWKFKPAKHKGKSIAISTKIPLKFKP